MPAAVSARTPGLYFENQTPERLDALPRLDIAAFVGFAASGPIDVPVPIEDAGRFEELFGRDLTIGDGEAALQAQLAPAVRAFFRNGGRRCWVVRVARAAATNRFVLPGLIAVDRTARPAWSSARASARSAGAWSDDVRVNSTLLERPLPAGVVALAQLEGTQTVFSAAIGVGTFGVASGDLVRIEIDGSTAIAFLAVPHSMPDRDGRVIVPWADVTWLEEADSRNWPFVPGDIVGARHLATMRAIGVLQSTATHGMLSLVVDITHQHISAGDWLEIDVRAGLSGTLQTWLAQVDRTRAASGSGSPSHGAATSLEIEALRVWRFTEPPPPDHTATFAARVQTLELWTRQAAGRTHRLSDLGMAPAHARFWNVLPSDADLFSPPELPPLHQRGLMRDAATPRFPLAGTRGSAIFLPLGVPAAFRPEFEQAADPQWASRLERDGLRHIDADLFVDRDLRDTTVEVLLDHAFELRHADSRRGPRALTGAHAVLHVDEIGIIAAPDALLRERRVRPMATAASGVSLAIALDDASATLQWTHAPDAIAYTVQQSLDADFARTSVAERLVPGLSPSLVVAGTQLSREFPRAHGACAPTAWYRIRVEGRHGAGPWSNSVSVRPAAATFDTCGASETVAPLLSVHRSNPNVTFAWTDTGAAQYRLESSAEPTFSSPRTLFDGPSTFFSIHVPPTASYARVRARTEPAGAWSNTVSVGPDSAAVSPHPDTAAAIDADTPVLVQTNLLKMCAARGDLFAVLGTPYGSSDAEAIAHRADLVDPFFLRDDRRTPSFGALYHPWLLAASEGRESGVREVAPCGTMCGQIAARTIARGAWHAPANQRLAGVVSTSHPIGDRAWTTLNAAHVNGIVVRPHGFVALSAHTLSTDVDVREISVRRLMILLRRLAVREGASLVFEPNGPDLRRAVRRRFETILGSLFVRGAFAGKSQPDAFRVVIDESNNSAQSVDLGRLVVELRVAPSKPLVFLTVRFVVRGAGAGAAEGA